MKDLEEMKALHQADLEVGSTPSIGAHAEFAKILRIMQSQPSVTLTSGHLKGPHR